jgi:hypothetical protein
MMYVGIRRQEPDACRRGEMARSGWDRRRTKRGREKVGDESEVSARLDSDEGSIREGQGHGGKDGSVYVMGRERNNRFT